MKSEMCPEEVSLREKGVDLNQSGAVGEGEEIPVSLREKGVDLNIHI